MLKIEKTEFTITEIDSEGPAFRLAFRFTIGGVEYSNDFVSSAKYWQEDWPEIMRRALYWGERTLEKLAKEKAVSMRLSAWRYNG